MAKQKTNSRYDKLWTNQKLWLLVVIVVSLLFYGSRVPQVPVGYNDSDLFLVMGNKLGLVGGPGYPVYLVLLNIFTHLGLGVAYGGHLLSTLLAVGTLGLVFMLGWELYDKADRGDRKYTLVTAGVERWLLAMVPVAALGMAGWFWAQALFAERFMLTAFLMSAIIWLWLWAREGAGKQKEWAWWGMGLALGLGLSHQWVFWTLIPVIGWSLYGKRREVSPRTWVITGVVAIATMVLPFNLLPGFAKHNVPYSQVMEQGASSLNRFVISGYVGDGLVDIPSGSVLPKITARLIFNNWWQMVKGVIIDLGSWTGLVLVWVWLYHSKKSKQKYWLFGDVFKLMSSYSLGLALILPWGSDRLNLAQVEPYLMPLEVMMVIWFWFGWQEFVRRFGQSLILLFKPKVVVGVLIVAVVVPLGLRAWLVKGNLRLAQAEVMNDMYEGMMNRIEDNAIVTCYSYGSCYGLIYQQQVAGLKPGVTILPFYWQKGKVVVPGEDLTHFNYGSYPFLLFDAVTWNLDKRPIYAVDLFNQYYQFFGIDLGFVNFVPRGYYGQLTRGIPKEADLPVADYQQTQQLIDQPDNPMNIWEDRLMIDVARKHTLNAQVYMNMGLRDLAVKELNLASDLIHKYSLAEQQQILDARDQIESTPMSEFYKPGYQTETVDYILKNVQPLLDAKFDARAVEVVKGAVTVDPLSVKARLRWADLLNQTGDPQRALQEYYNVLVVDPKNQEALDKIATLESGVSQPEEQATGGEKPAF